MHAPVLDPRPFSATSQVVIDCSGKADFARNGLLEWVKACPDHAAVHVILPFATRSLQRPLVGLGCTVTARLRISPQKV